jgi:glucuronate isomerase
MSRPLVLHEDRLFPADPAVRGVARRLYGEVAGLPIISPHGHTDPEWFATNAAFTDAASLLLAPDHYLYRMLYSQGVPMEALGVPTRKGASPADPRAAWRLFASHQHLFRGTPSALWLAHVWREVFGIDVALDASTPAFRPRALFDRFNIELLATTESPTDELVHHKAIRESGWAKTSKGRVVTAYRPDPVVDPEHEDFWLSLEKFGQLSGQDVSYWSGYLEAHRVRRRAFIAAGATSTDHGHPSAATADLAPAEAEALYHRILDGVRSREDAELFRAQMLTEMARMSLDDGLVMQIHPGSFRNHNARLFWSHGRDKGADIPTRT